jgi:hypothetical protein
MKTFTLYSDPAHGWLCVTLADVLDVGLFIDSFSRYSYRDPVGMGSIDCKLYLEEDCDAAKFIAAFVAKHDALPIIADSHCNGESFIRRKPRLS